LIQIIARLLRIRCGFRAGLPEYSSAHFRVSWLVGTVWFVLAAVGFWMAIRE
jgi:hypothetical protein